MNGDTEDLKRRTAEMQAEVKRVSKIFRDAGRCEISWWGRLAFYAVSSIIAALVVVLAVIGTFFLISLDSHAREPAIVKVIGKPSSLRPTADIYIRWHRCFDCD